MHSTEEHWKCGVKLYRGLRVLENKDVSNMILIFHSNFRVWGFFCPYPYMILQQAYLEESSINTAYVWLSLAKTKTNKKNKAKHCNPHCFSCHKISVTTAVLNIYRDIQTESSNVKSFKLCFKYLTKEKNAFLLAFHLERCRRSIS